MQTRLKTLNLPAFSLAMTVVVSAAIGAPTARQLAIVPHADATGFIAMKSLNAAPIVQKHKLAVEEKTNQVARALSARQARFEAATGLTGEDIIDIGFSCDMDTFNMDGKTPRERTAGLRGLTAIAVAKPLSISKIKKAITLELGSPELAGVADITIANHAALKINATKPSEPHFYLALTQNQRVVLLAFNAETLEAALRRAISGQVTPHPDALSHMHKTLPGGSQIQMACVIPQILRTRLKHQINTMNQQASQNPGLAAFAGIARLFQGLKTFSMGVRMESHALITLGSELGSQQEAQQAGILLKNMFIPMIQASMMQNAPQSQPVPNLEKNVSVTTTGNALNISLRLTEKQLMQKWTTTPSPRTPSESHPTPPQQRP